MDDRGLTDVWAGMAELVDKLRSRLKEETTPQEYKDIANALAAVAKCEIQRMQVGRLAPGRPSKDRGDSFSSLTPADEEDEGAEADNG